MRSPSQEGSSRKEGSPSGGAGQEDPSDPDPEPLTKKGTSSVAFSPLGQTLLVSKMR